MLDCDTPCYRVLTVPAVALLLMHSHRAVAGSRLLALLFNAICSWAYVQVDHSIYTTFTKQVSF